MCCARRIPSGRIVDRIFEPCVLDIDVNVTMVCFHIAKIRSATGRYSLPRMASQKRSCLPELRASNELRS